MIKMVKKIQIRANVIFSLSSCISVLSIFFLSQILISLDLLKKKDTNIFAF